MHVVCGYCLIGEDGTEVNLVLRWQTAGGFLHFFFFSVNCDNCSISPCDHDNLMPWCIYSKVCIETGCGLLMKLCAIAVLWLAPSLGEQT